MVLVDTNILLYAVNPDTEQHAAAKRALERLHNGREPWALTWGILYEFLRVATHPRVFPKPLSFRQAQAFVDGLLRSHSCLVLTETSEHRVELAAAVGQLPRIGGNQLHDLHHAIVMREHGIRDILTCDTDFRLFPWVDIRSLTE